MLEDVSKEIDQGQLKINGEQNPFRFSADVFRYQDGYVDKGHFIYSRRKGAGAEPEKPIVAHEARSNSTYMAIALSDNKNFKDGNVNARFHTRNEFNKKMTYKTIFRMAGPVLLGTTTRIDKLKEKKERGRKPSLVDRIASLRALSVGRYGLSKTLGIDFKAPHRDVYPSDAE